MYLLRLLLFFLMITNTALVCADELVCPYGYTKDAYGAVCIRIHCPPGFVVDHNQPSGCAPIPNELACNMNCKTQVNGPAPEGRECPPCFSCPKNSIQVCNYYGNQCKCRDK